MAGTVSWERLRELAGFRVAKWCSITLYLNINPSTTATAGVPDTYLVVPPGSSDVAIAQDGSVSYQPTGGGARVTAGYLSLAKFANQAALERATVAVIGNSGGGSLGQLGISAPLLCTDATTDR